MPVIVWIATDWTSSTDIYVGGPCGIRVILMSHLQFMAPFSWGQKKKKKYMHSNSSMHIIHILEGKIKNNNNNNNNKFNRNDDKKSKYF